MDDNEACLLIVCSQCTFKLKMIILNCHIYNLLHIPQIALKRLMLEENWF